MRHAIQIIPAILIILILVQNNARQKRWGIAGSLAIFSDWLVTVFLRLLPLRPAWPHYSTTLFMIAVAILASCIWGCVASWRAGRSLSLLIRVAGFVLFLALQWIAFHLSMVSRLQTLFA
jgi:hypothetical protein